MPDHRPDDAEWNSSQDSDRLPVPSELERQDQVYADETDGRTFRLMEHNRASFVPSAENDGVHVFKGETIRMEEFAMNAAYSMRGTSYGGYLVLIYDERGEIIEYKTSSERLYENLEKLKKIPVGKWMDKNKPKLGVKAEVHQKVAHSPSFR